MATNMVQLTMNNEKAYPKINTHFTEIISTWEGVRRICNNGYNSGSYVSHGLRNKTGDENKMYEYYGGILIPNIEDYETLIVELNYGGNTNGSAQLSGGIVLYQGTTGTSDTDYGTGWQNQILMPSSGNYTKVNLTKIICVGARKGTYVVGSLWNTYSGNDIGWNMGFGSGGSTLRVIGIVR